MARIARTKKDAGIIVDLWTAALPSIEANWPGGAGKNSKKTQDGVMKELLAAHFSFYITDLNDSYAQAYFPFYVEANETQLLLWITQPGADPVTMRSTMVEILRAWHDDAKSRGITGKMWGAHPVSDIGRLETKWDDQVNGKQGIPLIDGATTRPDPERVGYTRFETTADQMAAAAGWK